ncbi:MAG: carbamoyltransferase C-terminal domain-containing protein [Candidatus Omnitrophota bacterium]
MKILGLAAPFGHDASAALLIDGKLVAAVEEERFSRKKHAKDQCPAESVRYCLKVAGLTPEDIDAVAFPWNVAALREKRLEYFFRIFPSNPSRAWKKFFRNRQEYRGQACFIEKTLASSGFGGLRPKIHWIEHHMAHAASSFFLSGFREAAVLSIDGGGEIVSTMIGTGQGQSIRKIKEIIAPDSLGNFYSTMTEYLGFEREDGEYKVMGMAPFGDAWKANLDHILWWDDQRKTYRCHDEYVWVPRSKRARLDKVYARKMVDEFGPERQGDELNVPYIHIAASTQKKLEDMTIKLLETYLSGELKKHGQVCFAGGCALNVSLNRVLLKHPLVKRLWVQPASHDAGGSLGAAVYVAAQNGERIEPMEHAYYGPEYSPSEIEAVLRSSGFAFEKSGDICEKASSLLAEGKIVGWFQGRMEWGPRALGNRSILGNPKVRGTNDRINAIIKFREKWRPFCPSILKEHAAEILGTDHPSPFMTLAFEVAHEWRERIPEAVHIDGTCRPQIVEERLNPRYYRLIKLFQQKAGVPVVINTSLNRRGEAMVCSPQDAILMFKESGLEYLAIGDYLVKK